VGKPKGKRPLEILGTQRRTILKWIFKQWDWGHGLVLVADCLEFGNEPPGSIKYVEFID
jgi:hypothetical protein